MKFIARWFYRLLARLILRRYRPVVIGVAGSIGKTAAKEAIAAALSGPDYVVRRTIGSFNAEIGVPVTVISGGQARQSVGQWLAVLGRGVDLLWRRQAYPKYLVLELGADKPGDLDYLLSLVKPRIGVLTAIAPEHLEFFGDLDAVADEESLIVKNLNADGVAVVNHDNQAALAVAKRRHGRMISYGWDGAADIRAEHLDINTDEQGRPLGMVVKVAVNGSVVPVGIPGVIGRHQAYPILAALAAATALDRPVPETLANLSRYQPPPGRMRLFAAVNNATIIDDSYNSSPDAVIAAIEALTNFKGRGRRLAILGQMSELGTTATHWHDQIGQKIAAANLDLLVTIGSLAARFGQCARAAGWDSERIINTDSAEAAAALTKSRLQPGDVVLIKGSRYPKPGYGGHLEKAVELLLEHPERDNRSLVGHP